MINNCNLSINSKDRVTLSYTKDTSLLAEEFNKYCPCWLTHRSSSRENY